MEAIELIKNNPGEQIELVITDFSMPGITGRKLAERIYSINPDVPVILCTGFSEAYIDENGDENNIEKYLEKPFNMREMAKAVRSVLDSRT
jgi:CheY-like chemotaxis protein